MWTGVRRELRHLEWESSTTTPSSALLTEWSATVTSLLAVRRAIGSISRRDDPFILLSTASRGAERAGVGIPADPAPQLKLLRSALDDVASAVADMKPSERASHLTAALQLAYELAHRVRIQVTDGQVRQWLHAGETALDGALHSPARQTHTGASMAAWQSALAAVQRDHDVPILRRGVALGHLSILEVAQEAIQNAALAGALPEDYSRTILADIRELGSAHLDIAAALNRPRPQPSKANQSVMLQLGTTAGQLTRRRDPLEGPTDRLDALLRSGIGHAGLVAGLTADPAARAPADRLQRLALEYLANPRMLQRNTRATASGAPTSARQDSIEDRPRETRGPIAATITPGTILDADTVKALCRARDVGVAASAADPARPPAILQGTDPAGWPRLITTGRQAVADLVASVTPMVYALTRDQPNREDLRGEMFVHLMRVAHAYDPSRTNAARWPRYAWETLQHLRWRGVDNAGVPRQRGTQPPRMIGLDGTEPISRDPRPDDVIAGRAGFEATRDAVKALPTRLREPLLLSMAGKTFHEIGDELGISGATAHRRTAAARRILQQELGVGGKDDVIRHRDGDSLRVPNHRPTETPVVPKAATTSTWETVLSLPKRPAPGLGPASGRPGPGIEL